MASDFGLGRLIREITILNQNGRCNNEKWEAKIKTKRSICGFKANDNAGVKIVHTFQKWGYCLCEGGRVVTNGELRKEWNMRAMWCWQITRGTIPKLLHALPSLEGYQLQQRLAPSKENRSSSK